MNHFLSFYQNFGIAGVMMLIIVIPLILNFVFSSQRGRVSLITIIIILALIIMLGLTYGGAFAQGITEDSPLWDCSRMGNRICGDIGRIPLFVYPAQFRR